MTTVGTRPQGTAEEAVDLLDLSGYVVTDSFFGAPFIDSDEQLDGPVPHRRVHGGFDGTDTRFRFHFPRDGYQGRLFNPLSGGNGGTESFFDSIIGEAIGGLSMCFRLGGYMVESNQGHIGDATDPKGGADPTLYGHRASAEAARFSKYLAAQIYGAAPHHSYVFGGSGGARRSPLCLENAPDVWDGAMPFMGGGDIAEPGNTQRLKGAQTISFCTMFNAHRVLGDKLIDVIDAMAPGGSGDPFATLDTHQREELTSLYRLGYPRGDEFIIGEPMGQTWQWAVEADSLYEQDPEYFENFWTTPGYIGHDFPHLVSDDRLDETVSISRVMTLQDVMEDPTFLAPEYGTFRSVLLGVAEGTATGYHLPCVIEVKDLGPGYRLGTGVRVVSGAGAGRQLYAVSAVGNFLFCDARGQTSNDRFLDVAPGDQVHVDNRRWLAYCYWTRHHVLDDPQFDFLKLDGVPVYRQHPLPDLSPLMGVCYSGKFEGKLMWVHHTHDASLWPPNAVAYRNAVVAAQGEEGAARRFRLRWNENAEHIPSMFLPNSPGRATTTWLVDYLPFVEQSLADLVDWVENGVEPVGTHFEYADGRVSLPVTGSERAGIQPVVHVRADGQECARVKAGESVTLEVTAEIAECSGAIVGVEGDFDGTGSFPFAHGEIDGSQATIRLSTTHVYNDPGTYFATAKVHAHRDGQLDAVSRRVPNLAQARIVVT
jgi:hypothetical protein